ncbi:MAG: DEAD/DEAH box helicase family protein [Bacteroidales bacterium]|nr:DEAD/DEAH box helicase family protein [Bacteroidales bacterium]
MTTPEQLARQNIDQMLIKAGWLLQDVKDINFAAGIGIAVREFPTDKGPADYILFVNRKAVGAIEAKPEGMTLSGVSDQTGKYIRKFLENIPHFEVPLPFAFESTGKETFFRDERDPEPRSRRVFSFHQPKTLLEWVNQESTLRGRLRKNPILEKSLLRDCQFEAITELERSFYDARPRALVQMATGSGKTFMAVSAVYRLIKFAKAKRVLFLVDRRTLGRQTRGEFAQYITPDDGRKFTELYNVQLLTGPTIDDVSKVCITTIQRLFSMLKGQEFDAELDELSLADVTTDEVKQVLYNADIPIETFDFIITDECHRSIYNQWRQVLEYFDAFLIGLTATPSKQTFGFFNQNLVTEYNHERAVADRVNVGYEVYRIKTRISEKGSMVEAGYQIDKRNRQTREIRWENLDVDLVYANTELDRSVVAKDQIRTIVKTFRDKLFTEIFPGRTEIPKTLVFAKDDSHAEDIVEIMRQEFGKGNDFCKKITYRTAGEKPEDLIASFRNSYNPRIAVTVDMISTGTDIRPLECLLFMRDVKSSVYFEQMKGRGTRVISSTDLKAVTPDVENKTHFIIVDAVGVTQSDKTDSRPLERKKSVPFKKLVAAIAMGQRDEDTLVTMAGRLAKLNVQLENDQRIELEGAAGGKQLSEIINNLLDAVDPDKPIAKAQELFNTTEPTAEQIEQAKEKLTIEACAEFDDPNFRNILMAIQQEQYQIIDVVSQDAIISAVFESGQAEQAVKTFKEFIKANKDEITALQIIYNQPYDKRHLTYEMVKSLAAAMQKPPYNLNTELVWRAYEQLEKSKVRKRSPDYLLTDIIALVRFGIDQNNELIPYHDTIDQRFNLWLENQRKAGNLFTDEQLDWLTMIKEHISTSLEITVDDFDNVPFYEYGGAMKGYNVFEGRLEAILNDLNETLVK